MSTNRDEGANRRHAEPRLGTRAVSIPFATANRAQTTQDFAVGIGIFLLATAFVFAFLPTVMTPFSGSVGGGETAQADRVAATIVGNLSESASQPNHLNGSAFDEHVTGKSSEDLDEMLGLRSVNDNPLDRVNVTVRPLNSSKDGYVQYGGDDMAGGSIYEGSDAVSVSRIVTVWSADASSDIDECEPACRLVVRVW